MSTERMIIKVEDIMKQAETKPPEFALAMLSAGKLVECVEIDNETYKVLFERYGGGKCQGCGN